MKSFRNIAFGGIVFIAVMLLIIFRFELRNFLIGVKILPQYFLDPAFSYESFQKLKIDDQSLRLQLENLSEEKKIVLDRYHYLEADVYSFYPFNNRDLFIIDAGSDEGLRPGMPVLAAKGVVLGKIKSVARTQSEVQTIFDQAWKSSVAVGAKRYEARFMGGLDPHLDLIAKDAVLNPGDEILNLSPDLPFNFSLGEVNQINRDPTETWQTASVNLPYKSDALSRVLVMIDFP